MKNWCKYDIARTQFVNDNGKTESYTMCSACGKWHKGQFGIEISCTLPDVDSWMKMKLCRKCAKRFSNDIESLIDKLHDVERKEDTSKVGMKIKEIYESMYEAIANDFESEVEDAASNEEIERN